MDAEYLANTGPDHAYANAYLGTSHLLAGDTEKAREHLERGWDLLPERPNKVGSYSGELILPMIALRQDAGDAAGAHDLIERSLAFLDGREAANMTDEFDLMYRGFLLLYSGQEQEGLDTLHRAVEAGHGPGYVDYYLMERFADLDFTPIMALFEARRDVERDEFLKAVCNDGNPAPEVWTPQPETCEGYVEG